MVVTQTQERRWVGGPGRDLGDRALRLGDQSRGRRVEGGVVFLAWRSGWTVGLDSEMTFEESRFLAGGWDLRESSLGQARCERPGGHMDEVAVRLECECGA